MAVEQRQAWIVRNEIDFRFLVTSEHHDIFPYPRCRLSCEAGQFKAVTVEVDGMDVITGVAHSNAVTLALLQVKGGRDHFAVHRMRQAIDRPAVEAFVGSVLFGESHVKRRIR